MVTAEESLQAIVEHMSEQEAERVLDYLNPLADPETLTEEELTAVHATAEEMQRGEFVTLEQLGHELGLAPPGA
jgi:hypothetical protein